MIRRPPRSTLSSSSAASDVYKRQAVKSTKLPRKLLPPQDCTCPVAYEAPRMIAPRRSPWISCACPSPGYQWVSPGGGCMHWTISPDTGSSIMPVSYTHLRAHETPEHLVCRLLLEKKKT
eukprot:TRINITY_DN10376_c0_g1_i3.p1 TRINITY_DN10376_c0_g1~~TRINITY_DN10376_c0_g1_i3.p1  ORF type:complete len:120 (+),score=24.79 TRINITY_DN10376_c0_g1_i3:84-443(+)